MDKLRALKYFIEVAETASFSKAADVFDVPASSISRRILDLEKALGIALFRRSTRMVKLTELGTLYLEQVKPAVAALKFADEVVGEHSKMPSGILKITAAPDYGRFRLLPALAKLNLLYPQIICDVILTDEITNLAQSDVDIAIRATSNLPDRAVARKLSVDRFVLVASPAYRDVHGLPKTVANLQDHKALLYRRPQGLLNWHARIAGEWRELNLPPAFISNQGDALLDAAIAGHGIALVPKWSVLGNLTDGTLVEIELADAQVAVSRNADSGIYLLYHKPKYGLKKIRASVDFLLSELSEEG